MVLNIYIDHQKKNSIKNKNIQCKKKKSVLINHLLHFNANLANVADKKLRFS